jgi:hypothetical protein
MRLKNITKFATCALLLCTLYGFKTTSICTVENTSGYTLGTVTLSWAGGSKSLQVGAREVDQADVSGTVTSITINGTTVTKPVEGTVLIGAGQVQVKWPSDNWIEVIDPGEILSPTP